MQKIKFLTYTYPILFLISLLIIRISRASENLSGKFFSRDFALFSGYYANDFLSIGAIFFLILGIVIANNLVKYVKRDSLTYILFLVLAILSGIFFTGFRTFAYENDPSGDSFFLLIQLVDVWVWAWLIGFGWVYGANQMEKRIKKDINENI